MINARSLALLCCALGLFAHAARAEMRVENAWVRGAPLQIHGWIYGTHDGLLRDLGPTLSSLAERDALVSIDERVLHPVEPRSSLRRHAIEAFAGGARF